MQFTVLTTSDFHHSHLLSIFYHFFAEYFTAKTLQTWLSLELQILFFGHRESYLNPLKQDESAENTLDDFYEPTYGYPDESTALMEQRDGTSPSEFLKFDAMRRCAHSPDHLKDYEQSERYFSR